MPSLRKCTRFSKIQNVPYKRKLFEKQVNPVGEVRRIRRKQALAWPADFGYFTPVELACHNVRKMNK
jgi:hypothetical protein